MRDQQRGVVAGTAGFFAGGLANSLLQLGLGIWPRAAVTALVAAAVVWLLMMVLPRETGRDHSRETHDAA